MTKEDKLKILEIDTIYWIDDQLFLVTSEPAMVKNMHYMGNIYTGGTFYNGIIYNLTLDQFFLGTMLYKTMLYETMINKTMINERDKIDKIFRNRKLHNISTINRGKFISFINENSNLFYNLIYNQNLILEKIHVYTFKQELHYIYPIFQINYKYYLVFYIQFNKSSQEIYFQKKIFSCQKKHVYHKSIGTTVFINTKLDDFNNVQEYIEKFYTYEKNDKYKDLLTICREYYTNLENFLRKSVPIFNTEIKNQCTPLTLHKKEKYANFYFTPTYKCPFFNYYIGTFNKFNDIYTGYFIIETNGQFNQSLKILTYKDESFNNIISTIGKHRSSLKKSNDL